MVPCTTTDDYAYHALSERLALPTYAKLGIGVADLVVSLVTNIALLWIRIPVRVDWQSYSTLCGKVDASHQCRWKQMVPAAYPCVSSATSQCHLRADERLSPLGCS